MKHVRCLALFVALLASACGAEPAAIEPTAAPAAAPTEELFVSADSAPLPSPSPIEATATVAPRATAAPTERIIPPAATKAPASPVPTEQPRATAAPTAQAASATQATPNQPVRLAIGEIGIDGNLISVGLDKARIPVVPKHDIGWYNLSAKPGQGENIVLWGHVLRFRDSPKIPAPFARIKELKPGAAVVLYDKAGNAHNYVVTQQIQVTPEQVEYILPRGKEMLTMVSCIGDKIISNGEVVDESHRLITIAEPAA